MRDPKASLLRDLLMAAVSVVAAVTLTFAVMPFLNGRAPMLLFLAAVIACAAQRGLRSGLLATTFSLLAMAGLFAKTISVVIAAHSELAVFAIVALASAYSMDRLHRANAAVAQAQWETDQVNRKLLDHSESLALVNVRLAQNQEVLALAHEQLRQVAELVARDMQVPLKAISDLTALLDQSNHESRLSEHAGLITAEIARLEAMIAGLRDHTAVATLPARVERGRFVRAR